MKCTGRLTDAELDLETIHPLILPKDYRYTELMIESCHRQVHHSIYPSLAKLRTRFWVPRGRQYVKRIIGKCKICKMFQGQCYGEPPMAQLSACRVREAPSFAKVGVDFAGSLNVKGKTREWKRESLHCVVDLLCDLRCSSRFKAVGTCLESARQNLIVFAL